MTTNPSESAAFDRIDATKDAVTVKRVFGDAYHHDGVTVIPVAAVRGAAVGGEDAVGASGACQCQREGHQSQPGHD